MHEVTINFETEDKNHLKHKSKDFIKNKDLFTGNGALHAVAQVFIKAKDLFENKDFTKTQDLFKEAETW